MLSNAYFLGKIGADTAEIERKFAVNLPKIGNYPRTPPPSTGHYGHWGGYPADHHYGKGDGQVKRAAGLGVRVSMG